MLTAAHLPAFDPWTSSSTEALRADEERPGALSGPGPLAQHQAAQDVLAAQERCRATVGGGEVLRCLALCMVNGLTVPGWLGDAYLERYSRVTRADVRSWDEAFGAPWPPRTRLAAVAARRLLQQQVYAAVRERLERDPNTAVTRILFDEISELPEIVGSATTCEKAYYRALRDGLPNPLATRAMRHTRTPL